MEYEVDMGKGGVDWGFLDRESGEEGANGGA